MSLVRFRLWAPFAGLAHLVERHLAKVEVASSSLVARSRVNQDIRFGCPDFFVRRKELDTDTHARSAIGSEVRQGSCELRNAIRGMPGSEFEPRSPLQKEVQTRCLCLNTRSVFLTIEAGIPRIAVDNLWITGRQVRGPTFSVSILLPVKADALFLPPFTLSPPKSPRSNGICIAFLRSAMECGNANMLRFDEYGRMEVAA